MRILHLCQRDDPDTGGSLRVAEALVREQRKLGHDVWLLFLYGDLGSVAQAIGTQVETLGLASSREAPLGVLALRCAIWRIRPDVVHSHDGIFWPRLAFLFNRTPLVMHSHLPISMSSELKSRMGSYLVKSTTDLLIGISLPTIETWVQRNFPPSKIHYVPNGVDVERFSCLAEQERTGNRNRLGLPVDKRILLWVGRVHRQMKGSDRVEKVARMLPADTCLVVVGDGPDASGMRERCADLIASGSLLLAGSCAEPEIYYQTADIFLFTSYYEPFGLVILEAAAAGLPIVSFPVTGGGGAVQLLEEVSATMLGNHPTVEDLLKALNEKSVQFPQTSQQVLDKYNWSRIAKMIHENYELAINPAL